MELANESQTKGIYFMITTKTEYKNTVKEVKAIVKYIGPNQEENERQEYQSKNYSIINSNISTCSNLSVIPRWQPRTT